MKNILVIDIGNSFIKIGLFNKNDQLLNKVLLKTKSRISFNWMNKIFRNNFHQFNVDSCIIGSVVLKFNKLFEKVVLDIWGISCYFINKLTKFSFTTDKINLCEVGDDILALSEYCTKKSKNAIGFSFGTAMFAVYIFNKKLKGVSIAAGIGMSFYKLFSNVCLLKKMKLNKYSSLNYGNNTKAALESGFNNVRTGFVMAFYNGIDNKHKDFFCVISGGECGDVQVDFPYLIDENAILLGFKFIYELNNII